MLLNIKKNDFFQFKFEKFFFQEMPKQIKLRNETEK